MWFLSGFKLDSPDTANEKRQVKTEHASEKLQAAVSRNLNVSQLQNKLLTQH
jgi:hypothetical protein